MAFEDLVFVGQLIDELQHIGQARAAGGAHAKADSNAFAASINGAPHMVGGGFCHADSHRDSLPATGELRANLSSACNRARPP
ncbi:hypothetical protein D3C79_940040 [compost metagenome]